MDTAAAHFGAFRQAVGQSAVGQAAGQVVDHVAPHVAELTAQIQQFKAEKVQMLKDFEAEKKRMVAAALMDRLTKLFDWGMGELREIVKEESTDDPWMPICVRNIIRDFIDAVYPDFKAEVRDAIMTTIADNTHRMAHGEPSCCGSERWYWMSPVAFFRYNLFPYDRNVWRKIRNPVWWLCQLVSLVPRYGVAQIYYTLIFLLIDKRDEFQLVRFISDFKSLQFLNLGILSAAIGSVQYFVCTTSSPNSCQDVAAKESLYTLALFAWQVVMIWIAFGLTWCSMQKGGVYHQLSKEQKAKYDEDMERLSHNARKRKRKDTFKNIMVTEQLTEEAYEANQEMVSLGRTRLLILLIYDLFWFLICVGLLVWVALYNMLDPSANVSNAGYGSNNWRFESAMYWVKSLYGLMSLPFLVLVIPGVKSLFSHARETGYNPYGNTVPYLGKEEDGPVPWEPTRPYADPEDQRHADEHARKEAEKDAKYQAQLQQQQQQQARGMEATPVPVVATSAGPYNGGSQPQWGAQNDQGAARSVSPAPRAAAAPAYQPAYSPPPTYANNQGSEPYGRVSPPPPPSMNPNYQRR